MAPRSTRNKIRFHLSESAKKLEGVMSHLKQAEELAAGRHPLVNDTMPKMVWALNELQSALLAFREEI